MKFQFTVHINEQDYLDFNIFCMLGSPHGKKQIKSFRIIITVVVAIFIAITLFEEEFSADTFFGVLPMVIFYLLTQVFLTKFFKWMLKRHIKSMKKSGKAGYSPESVLEFSEEDSFVETTPENKTEQKYSAIDRVSIVDNKMIYIHINNLMAYMLPVTCFESKEQYDEFIIFVGTKCPNIDIFTN